VIQTIAKPWYRLVAPIVPVNGTHKENGSPVSDVSRHSRTGFRKWMRAVAIPGVAVLFALIAVFSLGNIRARLFPQPVALRIHSLAVLPLKNLSGDSSQDYFADGMTDQLITFLSQISGVRVISYTSTYRYKNIQKGLPEIAHELGVDGVVEGSVQREGGRVRVNAVGLCPTGDPSLGSKL